MRPKIDDEQKRLRIRNFRMADEDWAVLERHFADKRIPVGTGIRMVLMEYLRKERLL